MFKFCNSFVVAVVQLVMEIMKNVAVNNSVLNCACKFVGGCLMYLLPTDEGTNI